MAKTVNEDSGVGRSVDEISNGKHSESGSGQVENGTPSTSPPYWDSDDDDYGLQPSEFYGKHEWKIEKFSEINERELRSTPFEVGGYKWHILIYPQGCDVSNYLSVFLRVANHDKLLPGWSRVAQFTVSLVHKDSNRSKFSDTLHRFWKKEHDWGWKKFMELPRLQDGFVDDSDSLRINAQVQVIRDWVDRPFRCLDYEYRRELLMVYLSNVEQHCQRFVEEKRSKLGSLIEDKSRWTSLCVFWLGMDQNSRRQMCRERMDVILKGVVKQFFIEKEVTSSLVMDSLYSGLKALVGHTNKNKKARPRLLDSKELPAPIVSVDKDMFVLVVDDVLLLVERAALEPLPPKDEKGPQNKNPTKISFREGNKEDIERDERRLTELGRRTLEIYVLAHIFSSKIEVAYEEAVALKRQEELIREEEEARAKRGAGQRVKKSKKKQSCKKGSPTNFGEVVKATHTRPDGSFVDRKAQQVNDAFEKVIQEKVFKMDLSETSDETSQLVDLISHEQMNELFIQSTIADERGRHYGIGNLARILEKQLEGSSSATTFHSIQEQLQLAQKKIDEQEARYAAEKARRDEDQASKDALIARLTQEHQTTQTQMAATQTQMAAILTFLQSVHPNLPPNLLTPPDAAPSDHFSLDVGCTSQTLPEDES